MFKALLESARNRFNPMMTVLEPKIETKFEVRLEAGSNTAKMIMFGVIRPRMPWEPEGACISADDVEKKLKDLKGKNIDVQINSGGGDVFESVCIRNLFLEHDGEVNGYILARAGSGASVLVTGCKKVYMYSNCMQMLHNAWTFTAGNAKQLRKMADDLDKISEAAFQSYKKNFVGTEEELRGLLDEETWLTAEECLAFGLCTEIIEEPKKEDPAPQVSTKENLFAKYRKEPQQMEAPAPGGSVKETLFNKFKRAGN